MIQRLRRYLRSVRGLGTVPGLLAMALWIVSLGALWIDLRFPSFSNDKPFRYFYTDYETAQSVLSTIASASITTLGLVYSIVLVVFTTAAGNIGPRLLQRFTGDRVNQFTAGLFGGTFLFSLTVLHQTDEGFIPSFSIACTFLLAGLSVLQLIYFVHSASVSVTIDEEVAEIAGQLESDIQSLVYDEDVDDYSSSVPKQNKNGSVIKANRSGYVTLIHVDELVGLAQEKDKFVTLVHGQGSFVVPGQVIAQFNSKLNDDELEDAGDRVRNAVTVSRSRSPNSDIEFSINLLIEIALRALSPGVNDTYTAVACMDRISSALVSPVKDGLRDHVRADGDDNPRLLIPGLTLEDIINTAFHPMRRASAGNVLMTKHILDALGRLYEIGDKDARKILKMHADLTLEGSRNADLLKDDLSFISGRHKRALDHA